MWQCVKGVKLDDKFSNKWNLRIDVEKVKEKEKQELDEILNTVKKKEELISQTEMLMQQKSIYNETYKPQFINEMSEDQLEDFSNVLSQKLRQVKLAISKANIGQTKFMSYEEDKKKKEYLSNHYHEFIKKGYLQKKYKVPFSNKKIVSHYNFSSNKLLTTRQKFEKNNLACELGYKETLKECEKLERRIKKHRALTSRK